MHLPALYDVYGTYLCGLYYIIIWPDAWVGCVRFYILFAWMQCQALASIQPKLAGRLYFLTQHWRPP